MPTSLSHKPLAHRIIIQLICYLIILLSHRFKNTNSLESTAIFTRRMQTISSLFFRTSTLHGALMLCKWFVSVSSFLYALDYCFSLVYWNEICTDTTFLMLFYKVVTDLFHMDSIALLTMHRIRLTADYISPGMQFGLLLWKRWVLSNIQKNELTSSLWDQLPFLNSVS